MTKKEKKIILDMRSETSGLLDIIRGKNDENSKKLFTSWIRELIVLDRVIDKLKIKGE